MRYWIEHQGVPIGSAELAGAELDIAEFAPTDAYLSVRGTIRQASVALWGMGFFHPELAQPRISIEDLGRAARLAFDLRDENGRIVPTDFINVVERPHEEATSVVFVRRRHAHSGVPSKTSVRKKEPGTHSDLNGRGDR